MAKIAELLTRARQQLAEHSDSAALDAELLLCHCLGQSRTYLRTWSDKELDPSVEQRFESLLARRLDGEPVAYLVGERGFWTLDLAVSPATLIPRPETELLVEQTLQLIVREDAMVLDLGTGTGAIALALAAERPGWRVVGADVQPEAVALAERNRERLGLDNVELLVSSWFDAIAPERFDAIISNPPYVNADDLAAMPAEYHHEPPASLGSGIDGLDITHRILAQAGDFLAGDGGLFVELGYSWPALEQAYPRVPFTWLEFEHGGEGVFTLSAQQWQHYSESWRR